jgi:hypothetical protein
MEWRHCSRSPLSVVTACLLLEQKVTVIVGMINCNTVLLCYPTKRAWFSVGSYCVGRSNSSVLLHIEPVRLAGGLVLVCSERKVLLAGCW